MQLAGGNDVFVTKFNGERSGLAFSTFVGELNSITVMQLVSMAWASPT